MTLGVLASRATHAPATALPSSVTGWEHVGRSAGTAMARRRPSSHPLTIDCPFASACIDYEHNLLVGTKLRRVDLHTVRHLEDLVSVGVMARSAVGGPAGREFTRPALAAALKKYVRGSDPAPRRPAALGEPVRANLELIAARVGLDPVEQDVLRFCVALEDQPALGEFVRAIGDVSLVEAIRVVAAAIARYPHEVQRALAPGGRLVSSGLIELASGRSDVSRRFDVMTGLADLVCQDRLNGQGLLTRFLPEAKPADVGWADFAHLEVEARLAGRLLCAAVLQRRPGVNILLHGASGTGKTSIASLLASEAGATLHRAGGADHSGESPSARERAASLLLGQKLLGGGNAVVLFDEMEDLFEASPISVRGREIGQARLLSKQWFNLLLETNAVPIIWITNSVEGVDPAVLRRFSYAVEFTKCGSRQRARALERHLTGAHTLSATDISAVAERFAASPAHVATAVTATRLLCGEAGPDRPTLEAVLAPIERLVEGTQRRNHAPFDAGRWSSEGLNCSADPIALADRLTRSMENRPASRDLGEGSGLSLCLYGRPGTGKSEYVRYLAWRLGRPVLVRRVSDILSKWVGEAERHIAEAFRQAEDDGAVLLFDEADTFLRSRANARQSWEVSQVNEFLQQLEASKGLVACTTNLWQDLDEAALRRFTFKIEFKWLDGVQGLAVFRSVLGPLLDRPLAEGDVERLLRELGRFTKLAPGDFAVVARRVRATTGVAGVEELLEDLAEEVRMKGGSAGKVGF